MRQRARKRGRECARAEEGAAVSSLAGSSFPFLSLSLFLPPPLSAPRLRRRRTRLSAALCPASIQRNRLLSCARVCARTRDCVCRNDREREREREGGEGERAGNPAAPRGPSRRRRINRCALHLAPPPLVPPSSRVFGCHCAPFCYRLRPSHAGAPPCRILRARSSIREHHRGDPHSSIESIRRIRVPGE